MELEVRIWGRNLAKLSLKVLIVKIRQLQKAPKFDKISRIFYLEYKILKAFPKSLRSSLYCSSEDWEVLPQINQYIFVSTDRLYPFYSVNRVASFCTAADWFKHFPGRKGEAWISRSSLVWMGTGADVRILRARAQPLSCGHSYPCGVSAHQTIH